METFEWDENKNKLNIEKHHGVSFGVAQQAFLDKNRIIAKDLKHSENEDRFYCFGKVGNRILSVRFTMRGDSIRIFGAGYWRKGKAEYEKQNKIH